MPDVLDIRWEDADFWTGPTEVDNIIEPHIDRVLTQYRESPRLLALARNYLRPAAQLTVVARDMLNYFDINTAVGDQLTILGKALGWPRCHCAGQRKPVFGFDCFDPCGSVIPVAGFCEAEWDCGEGPEYIEFCFTRDEMYRGFLKSRVIALTGDFTRRGLTAGARALFGPDAVVYREEAGSVTIATGRLMDGLEISISHLYRQVLPLAPGVDLQIWHGQGAPFGFGEGWGGFCDGSFPVRVTNV